MLSRLLINWYYIIEIQKNWLFSNRLEGKGLATETDHKYSKVEELLDWLATFGQSKHKGVTRLLYSPEWVDAQKALKEKMDDIGLKTSFDSVGNLFGRLSGTAKDSKTILVGSHVDTVVNGGKYDGAYGIAAGMVAVNRLYQTYGQPKKSIEVVSLCEEEGSRFPLTYWGSGNITGKYTLKDVQAIQDSEGQSFLEAMKEAGFDPESYHSPVRNDLDCFIELHIEQGKVLETSNQSLGMVSHIVGQKRFDIHIQGESNHAGTTPMYLRKDAMFTASTIISHITTKAKTTDPQLVATVGKLLAYPNVVNVIAGEVKMTLDVRHHQKEVLDQFCQELLSEIQSLAKKEVMDISVSQWMTANPIAMDKKLTDLAVDTAGEKQLPFQTIISGAGHDAQMFAQFCPTALIFVPSKDGISHSPYEFTKLKDLETGIDLLTDVLYKLAY
jgi:allantoate deiminase